jgi:hypothetical protein
MKTLAKTLAIVALLVSSAATQANNPNLPKGIIYQIEIEATDIQKSNDVILEYAYLRKINLNNKEYFQFGKFTSFTEADSVKQVLTKAQCKNVAVIAFNNQQEISIAEAISLQYKETLLTATPETQQADQVSHIEVEYLLQVQRSGLTHYYALAVPITSVEVVDQLLETVGDEQIVAISADNHTYSIGAYKTLEEVIEARKKYMNSGLSNVFIMAQIDDERINESDAKNLASTIQLVIDGFASK